MASGTSGQSPRYDGFPKIRGAPSKGIIGVILWGDIVGF